MAKIWEFKTAQFSVIFETLPEYDVDLSFDDDGSIREGLQEGLYVAFVAKVAVYYRGREVAADYLGGCIYESPEDFMDHRGLAKGCGSYFSDMVRNAIAEARKVLSNPPRLRAA